MNNVPRWLPSLVSVDGEFNEVLKMLYGIFKKDFIDSKPHYKSIPIWHDRNKKNGEQYEEGFWHLVTRDFRTEYRLFDPRRAERLPWCAPTINNSKDSSIKVWDYKAQKRTTTYLWLEAHDYVVLLEIKSLKSRTDEYGTSESRKVAFLITGFHVDGEYKRRNLRKKYEKRKA